MKIVSVWENAIWFRLVILFLGFLIIFWINFFIFWFFIWIKVSYYIVLLWILFSILFWYLLKKTRYLYTLTDDFLIIKTPSLKEYKIPYKDIKNIWVEKQISLLKTMWNSFDAVNKLLYLCSFSKKWIVLNLWTHSIVISPRKFDTFYETISNKIYNLN